VLYDGIAPETALKVATSNPATILKLTGKGFIQEGCDADILVIDPQFNIIRYMAMGKLM
jgi:beta-aspartyl-dipeptidase (metallo-type)